MHFDTDYYRKGIKIKVSTRFDTLYRYVEQRMMLSTERY